MDGQSDHRGLRVNISDHLVDRARFASSRFWSWEGPGAPECGTFGGAKQGGVRRVSPGQLQTASQRRSLVEVPYWPGIGTPSRCQHRQASVAWHGANSAISIISPRQHWSFAGGV